jgi:hypothetical protein
MVESSEIRNHDAVGSKEGELCECFFVTLLLSACAHTSSSGQPDVRVQDRPDGFVVTMSRAKYEFVPHTGAMWAACKSDVMATAHDIADRRGREIQPLDEQRIRLSVDRNGLTGITSCTTEAVAKWK